MNRLVSAFLILICFPLMAYSQEKDTPTVSDLIAQLGSKSFRQRESAAKQLYDRGPVVLPSLRQALTESDKLEQRIRLKKMIGELEIEAALSPTMVKLNTEPRPLPEVLADIEKQTGYRLLADKSINDKMVVFRSNRLTFWQTVKQLEQQVGMSANVVHLLDSSGKFRSVLRLQDDLRTFTAEMGICRIQLHHIHERRYLNLTKSQSTKPRQDLFVYHSVTTEPKFLLLSVKSEQTTATDETGNEFSILNAKEAKAPRIIAVLEDDHGAAFRSLKTWNFRRPKSTAKSIKTLRGKLSVRMVVDRRPTNIKVTFPKSDIFGGFAAFPKKAHKIRMGQHTLEFLTYRDEFKRYQLIISNPKAKDNSWFDRIHLEDAKGNRYDLTAQGNTFAFDRSLLTMAFETSDNFGPPTRLVIENWHVLTHDVLFEFRNIPLP